MGVKAKLHTRLRINGNTTTNAICCFNTIRMTDPNEMAIKIYRTVHTGPKSHEGGDHEGFRNFRYHVYVFIKNNYTPNIFAAGDTGCF